jgi:diaminopimelate epimerase
MINKIIFYKLQASGNDFILFDTRSKTKGPRPNYRSLSRRLCQRKLGIGADGLLVIEPSKKALFKMRIFNPDGSEAEMCGNGARCVALWAARRPKTIKFDTIAGIIEAKVKNKTSEARIKVSDPFGIKLDMPLKVL